MPTHVIKANGVSPDPTTGDVQVPVFKKTTIINNDQIIALPTTAIELVAAQAGKCILIDKVEILCPSTVPPSDYGNIDVLNSNFLVCYGSGFLDDGTVTVENAAKLFEQPGNPLFISTYYSAGGYRYLTAPSEGLYLYVDNGLGNFTGGHTDNTLEVTVFYSIVDL